MTEEERDKADCVVTICRKCGRVVIAAVNIPPVMDRKMKNELGRAAADGHDIKHMPVEEVRKMPFGCQCSKPSKAKQEGLGI